MTAPVRKLITFWGFKVDRAKVEAFAKSIDRTKKNVDRVSKSLDNVGKRVKKAGKYLAGFGAAIMAGVVIPALKVEDSLKNTMTMVTATGDEFKRLEVGMRKFGFAMSNELGISAAKVNEGFYQVLSTGAKAMSKEFKSLAMTAMKMGKIVGLEPTEAVERLADSVNAFSLPMTKAREVADKFFKITQLAALNIPQLTMAMRDAGPAAAGLNVSLEETIAILGAFAQGGIKGAQAGTAFKMVISRLAAPTGDAKVWMDKLKVSTFDAAGAMRPMIDVLTDYVAALKPLTDEQRASAIEAIAGKLAMSKFLGLMNRDMGVLKRWTREIQNAGGAIDDAFKIKMSSGWQQLLKLKQEITNTAAEIGLNLIPTIKELGEKFRDWMKDNKQRITEMGKAFTTVIKNVVKWIDAHREGLIKAAKILAVMWGTSKIVAFGAALKELIISVYALAGLAAGPVAVLVAAFAALAAIVLIANKRLKTTLDRQEALKQQRANEAVDQEIADNKRIARQKQLEKMLERARSAASEVMRLEEAARVAEEKGYKKTAARHKISALASRRESADYIRHANKLRTLLGEFGALDKPDWATAVSKVKEKGKKAGNAFVTGMAEGAKNALDAILRPGFGPEVTSHFQEFLLGQFHPGGGGAADFFGQGSRKINAGAFAGGARDQQVMQAGAQTSNVRNVTYNIRGSASDGAVIASEIERTEQRDRAMARDFGFVGFPLSAVAFPKTQG